MGSFLASLPEPHAVECPLLPMIARFLVQLWKLRPLLACLSCCLASHSLFSLGAWLLEEMMWY